MDEKKEDKEMKEENKCGEKLKMEYIYHKTYEIFFFFKKKKGIDCEDY